MIQLEFFMPNLLKILIIIVGGWIFAWIMRWTVSKFLVFVRFDIAADKAGLASLLKKGDIKRTPAQLVGNFIYWIILFWVLISVVNAVGLTVVAQGLDDLWQYLPKVIGAIIILVIGLFFANVLSGLVRTGISSAGIPQANIFGTVAKYAIAIFTITITIRQLGITGVSMVFNIFFGALCFGLALAFGLGCKDIAGRWVNDMIKHYKEKSDNLS
ncbi:hypothetical protein ACFL1R_05115 [Candidatus Latescibacterota bacterium]